SLHGLVLTCAHCIGESEAEWRANKMKWLLFASGRIVRATCVMWDAKRDLALLKIDAAQEMESVTEVANQVRAIKSNATAAAAAAAASSSSSVVPLLPSYPFPSCSIASFSSSSSSSPSIGVGCALFCIGQPGSEDLECARSGVKTNYDLVHVSEGKWRGNVKGADLQDNSEIGTLMHDCWTYWSVERDTSGDKRFSICDAHSLLNCVRALLLSSLLFLFVFFSFIFQLQGSLRRSASASIDWCTVRSPFELG
ncbi:MAG: serine protease, partial [Dehalococcoidales bacterium]|nr:serine protease [Dehalococcoidales bacterium]